MIIYMQQVLSIISAVPVSPKVWVTPTQDTALLYTSDPMGEYVRVTTSEMILPPLPAIPGATHPAPSVRRYTYVINAKTEKVQYIRRGSKTPEDVPAPQAAQIIQAFREFLTEEDDATRDPT